MIFYFTGTGNSLAAARIIAEATDDLLVDIGMAYKHKDFDFTLEQSEPIGFVFPTYAWTTPGIVDNFIAKANFRTGNKETFTPEYCYAVVSCAAFVGKTATSFGKRLLEKQGINLDASFSIKSVGNCTYLYAPAQGERRTKLLSEADKQARHVALRIRTRECVHAEAKNPVGILLSCATDKEEKPRSTKEFYTLPTCISCGKCSEVCPTNTITLIGGTPRWAEMGCTQCLGCLHRCPVNAIQYGKRTETRGRFVNPVLES